MVVVVLERLEYLNSESTDQVLRNTLEVIVFDKLVKIDGE